jgi:hypothetical protein
MEADAAAIRIIERIGEQMVEIDDHRRHHDPPRSRPRPPIQRQRHCERNEDMEQQM